MAELVTKKSSTVPAVDVCLSLLDLMSQPCWSALPNGQVDFYNRAWCELTGTPADQVLKRDWTKFLELETLPEAALAWRDSALHGPVEFDVKLRCHSGEFRPFAARINAVQSENGEPFRIVGILTEISEPSQKQTNLDFSAEPPIDIGVVRKLLDGGGDDLATPFLNAAGGAGASGDVSLRALSGVAAPVKAKRVLLVEDNPYDALLVRELICNSKRSSQFIITHVETLAEALNCSEAIDVVALDLNLPDSDGLEALSALKAAKPDMPIVIVTGLDEQNVAREAVSSGAQDFVVKGSKNYGELLARALDYAIHRKHAELLTMRCEVERREAELSNVREDFLAALTHNIRIRAQGAGRVLGMFDQLGELSKSQSDILEQLKKTNFEMLDLLNELIDVYQYETEASKVELKPVDLAPFLSDYLGDFCADFAQQGLRIELFVDGDIGFVSIDRRGITRIMENLLDNAVKFAATLGSIKVGIRKLRDRVYIDVYNDGATIAADEGKVLFNRFWRGIEGKKYPPGTGLGLYLCRLITEAHGGEISCRSADGLGTTFTVSLPA